MAQRAANAAAANATASTTAAHALVDDPAGPGHQAIEAVLGHVEVDVAVGGSDDV